MNKPVSFHVSEKIAKSLEQMSSAGHKVEIVGQIKDGQVHLDADSLARLNQKFPGAHLSFVAVNAPFMGKQIETV